MHGNFNMCSLHVLCYMDYSEMFLTQAETSPSMFEYAVVV